MEEHKPGKRLASGGSKGAGRTLALLLAAAAVVLALPKWGCAPGGSQQHDPAPVSAAGVALAPDPGAGHRAPEYRRGRTLSVRP
jgi:hypothetical protein